MAVVKKIPETALWASFPEANRNEVLGLLSMLLERLAVFSLFEQVGTVHAVLRFLVEHQVQIGMRERSGPGKGEVA